MNSIESVLNDLKSRKLSIDEAAALLVQMRSTPVNSDQGAVSMLKEVAARTYAIELQAEAFYLRDHRVQGRRMLPGVMYLELAYAAWDASRRKLGGVATQKAQEGWRIKDVVWSTPCVVDERREIRIALREHTQRETKYEIYSEAVGVSSGRSVHSQGRIESWMEMAPRVDLEVWRRSCSQTLSVDECYERFDAARLNYGAAHRGLRRMWVERGPTHRTVVAQIVVPDCIAETIDSYVLHPSVLDSALQATAGVWSEPPTAAVAHIPFAVDEVRVYRGGFRAVWIRVTPKPISADITKVDIEVCDEAGDLCVHFIGLTLRAIRSGSQLNVSQLSVVAQASGSALTNMASKEPAPVLLQREWVPQPLATASLPPDVALGDAMHWIYLTPACDTYLATLRAEFPQSQIVSANTTIGDDVECFIGIAADLFDAIQRLLKSAPTAPVLVQVLITTSSRAAGLEGAFSALLKSVEREYPKLCGQVIALPVESLTASELRRLVLDNAAQLQRDRKSPASMQHEVRYRSGMREVARMMPLAPMPTPRIPWKEDGVYLISGGAGGLGRLLTAEIATKVGRVTLILIGRSALTAVQTATLAALRRAGQRIEYRMVDVCDAFAVSQLVQGVVQQYGAVHGVIHSAGVIQDRLIVQKRREDWDRVMATKLLGARYLDEATRKLPLDFFVMFSSLAGEFGNVGQVDYACANAALNRYADFRHELMQRGERHGNTLSIAWPLWTEGGMQVDADTLTRMQQQGLYPLTTDEGMHALYAALIAGHRYVAVMKASDAVINALTAIEQGGAHSADRRQISNADHSSAQSTSVASSGNSEAALRKPLLEYLRNTIADTLQLPRAELRLSAGLDGYGIDSVLSLKIVSELENTFGPLSKTLLFEYQTVAELCDHFLAERMETVRSKFEWRADVNANGAHSGINHGSTKLTSKLPDSNELVNEIERPVSVAAAADDRHRPQTSNGMEIAIIGLSGRYPKADTLAEFWGNLKSGKDCIDEIPLERWEYREAAEAVKKKLNKSYCGWGGFMTGVEDFDPLFFHISPLEAQGMDPQERLFLQCAYHVLEDAGYTRSSFAQARRGGLGQSVGVFVAAMYQEYQLHGVAIQQAGIPLALSGNPASVANRVSYHLNLRGPSITIDSMCSGSLTAISLACQSILTGQCDLAIAGGVNVASHPNKYLALAYGGFTSPTGRCRSFGANADGYVPGEGVGAVLLKPLQQAIVDGDHVYGVIRSIAINHGGRGNGYTVPNPSAQAEAISCALRVGGVDARHVSYLEAHGTGTSLGDPIEIEGLRKAYAAVTADTQFCAIGSVKSNIGHLESAAGIAGLTKVLLQMQHGTLVPSLHSDVLNPLIDFQSTPFRVQRGAIPWTRPVLPVADRQQVVPRIAGINSFGAGGSNAHLIVEEYLQPVLRSVESSAGPRLIVLSARSAAALRIKAQQLLAVIGNDELGEAMLADMAYTLQVGREKMDCRLAFVATSLAQITEVLQRFVDGHEMRAAHEEYYAEKPTDRAYWLELGADEDFNETLRRWMARKKYGRILEMWVAGLDVNWDALYGNDRPRRMSLPGYPFSKERCWIPDILKSLPTRRESGATLHPLVHIKHSGFDGQRYTSVFTGNEFFFADHRVNGRKILPGVAHIEMARAAFRSAICRDDDAAGDMVVRLRQVTWIQPIVATAESCTVHVALVSSAKDAARFEIFSGESDHGGETATRRIFSCGSVESLPVETRVEYVNIGSLDRQTSREISAADCYTAYDAIGLQYGAAHRGVDRIKTGIDGSGNRFALAWVRLPDAAMSTYGQFVLHPTLMDSALHAGIALMVDESPRQTSNDRQDPYLPFAVESMDVIAMLPKEVIAYIRPTESVNDERDIKKIDVDVCAPDGRLCARLTGFSSRRLSSSPESRRNAAGFVALYPAWSVVTQRLRADESSNQDATIVVSSTLGQSRRVDMPGLDAIHSLPSDFASMIPTLLARAEPNLHVVWLADAESEPNKAVEERLQDDFQANSIALLCAIKCLLRVDCGSKSVTWTLITRNSQRVNSIDEVDPSCSGLHALMGTLAKEVPTWRVRLVDLSSWREIASSGWRAVPAMAHRTEVFALRQGEWYRNELLPMNGLTEKINAERSAAYRRNGVYVVIGGAGAIGSAWTEHVASNHSAQVVWIGRRPEDQTIREKIAFIARVGRPPVYISADASDRESLRRAYESIKQSFGRIDGVVHSAMVLTDAPIKDIDEADWRTATDAKVKSMSNVADVFMTDTLDFVLVFSSLVSFIRNPGQSHYASGTAFVDAFSQRLADRGAPIKIVNWGFWAATATPEIETALKRVGIGLIEPGEAMSALEWILASPIRQIGLVKTLWPVAFEGMSAAESVDCLDMIGIDLAECVKTCESVDSIGPHTASTYCSDEILATSVAGIASSLAKSTDKIRIVEIGHGTGCASAAVLKRLESLREQIDEYCYTDMSRSLVEQADKHRCNDAPYLRSALFNAATPIAEQGFSPGRYDIVLLSSALPAAAGEVHAMLRNAKALLRGGGALVLCARAANPPNDARSNDDVEPGATASLARSVEAWYGMIEQEGFLLAHPGIDRERHEWHVIVAVSNGVVRQPRPQSASNDTSKNSAMRRLDDLSFVPSSVSNALHAAEKIGDVRGHVLMAVKESMAEALRIEKTLIETDRNFMEYGVDSILVSRLVESLRTRLSVELRPTDAFEYPTVDDLTDHICLTYATQLSVLQSHDSATAHIVRNDRGTDAVVQRPTDNRSKDDAGSQVRGVQQPELSADREFESDDIAIIGVSGKYPMADNLDSLWVNLREARDCITQIPAVRWSLQGFYVDKREAAIAEQLSYCRYGGFISAVDRFDCEFFGLSNEEAHAIGPRERIFLETSWNAIESAGYSARALRKSSIGVYVGVMPGTNHFFGARSSKNPAFAPLSISSIAHRVSSFFNFNGPSIAVDTQSSSSLVAIHMACESLRAGECEVALAGGVTLLYPELYYGFSQVQSIGSRLDSRSYSDGDGLLPSEGAGVVVLKPLRSATRDGDNILGVIKGSAVNHAGKRMPNMPPSVAAQAALFEQVIQRSAVDPQTIGYVESAAYGSPIGDAMEVAALSKAFGKYTSTTQFCALGTVKSIIGHSEAASGIAQLTKVLLQLKYRQLTPLMKIDRPNLNLRLDDSPFYLQTELAPWVPRPGVPRRALVNSFGAGGTYASILIEEHARPLPSGEDQPPSPDQLIVLSAFDEKRLRELAQRIRHWIQKNPDEKLADVAFTLQVGRDAMQARLAIVVNSLPSLDEALQEFLAQRAAGTESRQFIITAEKHAQGYENTEEAPLQDALQKCIEQRDLRRLALHWVRGQDIPWARLQRTAPVSRLDLPTSPLQLMPIQSTDLSASMAGVDVSIETMR